MSSQDDQEFMPLPYYPFDERPSTFPLSPDEAETAIYLSEGDVPAAARLLKVSEYRLSQSIRRSPRLQRLVEDFAHVLTHKGMSEYIRAFKSEDDRRREWAATKVLSSKAARDHPLSPAGQASLAAQAGSNARIIISWDDGSTAADGSASTGPFIEHE